MITIMQSGPQKIYYRKVKDGEVLMEGSGWIVSEPTLFKSLSIFADDKTISTEPVIAITPNQEDEVPGWTLTTSNRTRYKLDLFTLEQSS
jgi:hypothetical protein